MTCAAAVSGDLRPHVLLGTPRRYRVRMAQAADRDALRQMLEHESPEDLRLRFFRAVREVPAGLIDPMLREDGSRHLALVVLSDDPGTPLVASAMLVAPAGLEDGEFGIIVARRHAGQRIGSHLMACMTELARGRGLKQIHGMILAENAEMVDLARRAGFSIQPSDEPACVKAVLRLDGAAAQPTGNSANQDDGVRKCATPTM